jgi:PAS domain-containing protein
MEHLEARLSSRHAASLGNQLADKHATVQTAIQIGSVGIWEMDSTNGHFHWNGQMRKIYGLEDKTSAVSLEHWLSLLHPGDAPRVAREWNLALARNSSFHSQFRIVTPEGAIRHISAHATISKTVPATISAVGVNLDLTEAYRSLSTGHRRNQTALARRKPSTSPSEN